MTCERCEGIAVERAVRVPDGYLALAGQLRTWIAEGTLRELWSGWPLDALPESPPLPEDLLARLSVSHWLACNGDDQLFSLEVVFERDGLWSPRDPDRLPRTHPAVIALRP